MPDKSLSVYNATPRRRSWLMFVLELLNVMLIGGLIWYVWVERGAPAGDATAAVLDASAPGDAADMLAAATGLDPLAKKNIIFMVTDGMGPASLLLARSFRQLRDKLPLNDTLVLDRHLVGLLRTRSLSSLVTDSAAGATAFLCGLKTYNGAIGVAPNTSPCGTVLEAVKLQGYLTGLVVTTRITDATPAAFSAHTDYRFQEDEIAQQQLGASPLGRSVDLILGGGRCHFKLRLQPGSCRADAVDLVAQAQKQGWHYVGDRAQFDGLAGGHNVSLPLLGLLADEDIPYDLDRNASEYPSLLEQTQVALTLLSEALRNALQGFFLLIEGSRIDHAGHHNDAAAQVRETLAFDAAFAEVVKFIDESDTPTIVVSTLDHETGGLLTTRQVDPLYPDYLWYPKVLLNATHLGEYLARKIGDWFHTHADGVDASDTTFEEFLSHILHQDLGITDYTGSELKALKSATPNREQIMYILNDLVSVRLQTGWSTHGHSAVDVNIYGYTNDAVLRHELLQADPETGLLGNHENTEIGTFLQRILGADVASVTERLRGINHHPVLLAESNEEHLARAQHAIIVENLD